MKKIYHLSTCDTCKRIIKELQPLDGFELQDIKTENITDTQLEEMYGLTGSYEALFSKRARLYKEKGLADKQLTEEDYKSLILEHYTFLKRPVILVGDAVFVGNSKKVVAAAKEKIQGE
ncbi:MAG: ArsC/Spx/MgsR family protein [Cellulophaga sp.]|uniref:arsenate reductase family protein n=1 Tax=unclassified Cellulophaga TaxID=2634405 RepID=UPI000C2BF659|nr:MULTISPECIES: ArsC/Spx/MgsR family protein [unclassified Cellulophaga]MDO6491105.1 ArsC/Spx/MgsR family protein [Cellulophaga sp. 2_MG-2023]MDO6495362.1 ArsC/Spx/MgsR family protein [Cellulophaga sp. 3_MG-2023]PKB42928.1 arsenate reductase-like glutaredoxin family protein [Cellulophaga sp. RHA19]